MLKDDKKKKGPSESDDRDHNATAVHKFIEAIMRFQKTNFLVNHVHNYFSNGAVSQHKNYKM